MMRVLITGAQSYIGTSLRQWLPLDAFEVAEICVKNAVDPSVFARVDTVVHVAGIAHRKETAQDESLYFSVNVDLPVTIAQMAKQQGVKQFVFLSSMSVYGETVGNITRDTLPKPQSFYGQSKWQAEQALLQMETPSFRIAILRPPMIYGKGCKGNYPRLANLVCKVPFFPAVKNERSMLYIDTLCAFLQALIKSQQGGLFFPQNEAYVSTNELVTSIAKARNKSLYLVPCFGWLLAGLSTKIGFVGKVFGSLTYDQSMSDAFRPLSTISFEKTIHNTEENQ